MERKTGSLVGIKEGSTAALKVSYCQQSGDVVKSEGVCKPWRAFARNRIGPAFVNLLPTLESSAFPLYLKELYRFLYTIYHLQYHLNLPDLPQPPTLSAEKKQQNFHTRDRYLLYLIHKGKIKMSSAAGTNITERHKSQAHNICICMCITHVSLGVLLKVLYSTCSGFDVP